MIDAAPQAAPPSPGSFVGRVVALRIIPRFAIAGAGQSAALMKPRSSVQACSPSSNPFILLVVEDGGETGEATADFHAMEKGNHPPREHRRRVLKRATIVLDINTSEIPCTVRNQHPNGAELIVPIEAVVPERFTVYIPMDDTAYDAVLRWSRNGRIGVQFVGRGPKPRLHYG
jgi:hypothetical protein